MADTSQEQAEGAAENCQENEIDQPRQISKGWSQEKMRDDNF